jgi:hypothetical protein
VKASEGLIILFTLCGYIVPIVGVAALVWWMNNRSGRARAKGLLLLVEGRVLEAYESFERCNDRLLLRGQCSLWLWRLAQARSELDSAATIFDGRDEEKAAPHLALVAALMGERDAENWVMRSGARSAGAPTEARLGLAVMELRRGQWVAALQALPPSGENPRARGLANTLRAWAQTRLDAQARSVDTPALLGEGSLVELERCWPEFAQVLKAGTTVTADKTESPPRSDTAN